LTKYSYGSTVYVSPDRKGSGSVEEKGIFQPIVAKKGAEDGGTSVSHLVSINIRYVVGIHCTVSLYIYRDVILERRFWSGFLSINSSLE